MNQPMQGTRTKGRNPRYRVVQIKDGTAILETDVEREAVRAALAHNRKADDHLGVVYRGRFLKIAGDGEVSGHLVRRSVDDPALSSGSSPGRKEVRRCSYERQRLSLGEPPIGPRPRTADVDEQRTAQRGAGVATRSRCMPGYGQWAPSKVTEHQHSAEDGT